MILASRRLLALLLPLTVAFVPARAGDTTKKPDQKKAVAPSYVRLERNAKGEATALETAVVRFVPAKDAGGVTVDLVAAVHIGDKAYYKALNKLFDEYDVVLYELVAPPGTRIPKGGKRESGNPLALVQQLMTGMLQLESQTERIDYTKKHFVHADLSPDQMLEKMRERGDDPITVALSAMADMLRQQNLQQNKQVPTKAGKAAPGKPMPDLDLVTLLFDPDGQGKLKKLLAENLGDPAALAGFGQTLNTLLITDRNQAALKVLQKEIAAGKKRIAIFYGAAHMPDFEKRLQEDFGLKRQSEKWLTAWDLE
jgi:hypothetical protein